MPEPIPVPPRPFLGWPMVGLAFLLYGFGMAPAYYAWGFLAPEIIADIGLTRAQVGNTFGLFALTFAATSPLAAAAIRRIGLRATVATGATIGAAGFAWTSLADDPQELLWAYALTGGVGIGLCTLLPVQTLAVAWFVRQRARATGVILLGAGVVGAFVPAAAESLAAAHDWRFVFRVVAAILWAVGLFCALLLRDTPADVGQRPDGDGEMGPSDSAGGLADRASPRRLSPREWARLTFSRGFLLLTVACLANTVPWRVVTAHGRLHLQDLGFAPSAAAAILGLRVGLSGVGRLAGAAGDVVDPRHILSASLVIAGLGMALFSFSHTPATAYLAIALLGLAYGTGMTSEPVSVARVFGPALFLTTNGLRIAITGIAGWLAPRWVGAAADATGSYHTSLLALSGLCVVGAGASLLARSGRDAHEVGSVPRKRP
jgi:MFS family permease